ncbi:energy transducer TonB [Campylobacter upsaliensis]|uniref:energy transducer TonB n=1 Tax=Campylobacter upsaliensis TaxID=28080 RepID=UPI0013AC5476|nr:energy transducer TonB [Campylobacter upsaliensis]EDP7981029.1 energy transducer TonB [Campylobacter upsaliensis]EHR9974285.1 energy transducer TonB [Campylobacter upsaliensis]ELZ2673107.1 energy transducer TonB [Campylobacter upsaliensis]MEB2801595.1 energy transducer TonB [Campylobacter upsaliensis]MEB2809773.1 energy transducer TonB [Campylobacter upsaliensis]
MKNALLNTKVQASYITFLAFLPLLFTLIYTHSLFKTQINKEESLELAMKYFIQNESYLAPEKQALTSKQSSKIAPKKSQSKTSAKPLNERIENLNLKSNESTKSSILSSKQSEESALNKIQEAIQKAQIYPLIAQKKRMSGVVKVEFMWMSDKTLADLKIIQSSGYTLLDKSALESIRKASLNFPSYERNLKITLPISYEIKSL